MMLVVVLSAFMVLSVFSFGGLQIHDNVDTAVTHEEIDALNWLRDNYPHFWSNIICDDPCHETAAVVLFRKEQYEGNQENQSSPVPFLDHDFWLARQQIIDRAIHDQNVSWDSDWLFAIFSERLASSATFRLVSEDGKRWLYEAFPMMDAWSSDPEWRLVYSENGVMIYERIRS